MVYYVPSPSSLYIGGLDNQVDEKILEAAFIPFGEIVQVIIPKDTSVGVEQHPHKGFGFVEFETVDEALSAMDNMNNSELFGKVIRVNFARTTKLKEGFNSQAVWSTDSFVKQATEKFMEKQEDSEEPNQKKSKEMI